MPAPSPTTTPRSRLAALLATLLVAGAVSLTPAGTPSTAAAATVPTSEGVSAVQMDGGGSVHCAIRTDRTLWCWGFSMNYGGDFESSLSSVGGVGSGGKSEPQQLGTNLWLSISAGDKNICGIVIATALDTQGSIYCLGANGYGQLGVNPAVIHDSEQLRLVGEATNWKSLSVGSDHLCAISTSNALYCIGRNGSGQLGLGSGDTTDRWELQNTNNSANSVVAGRSHTCFLAANVAYCMGANYDGQLGIGTSGVQSDGFVAVEGGHKFSSLTAGYEFTCGVAINSTSFPAEEGIAYCWGANWAGQTGTPQVDNIQTAPAQVVVAVTFLTVQAGEDHVCGITSSGALYCWGLNSYSEAGEAATVDFSLPHQVGTATNWAEVSLGNASSCARTTATARVPSATYCWGDRTAVGNAIPTYFNVPTKIPGSGWLSVATNGNSRCAIQGAALPGKLYCSGANWSGEVGSNTTQAVITPIELPAVGGWREVAMGPNSTCAITGGGALYCWGNNRYGVLGVGDTVDRLTPTQVGSDSDWSGISLGDQITCAIKAVTTVYCWGSDDSGGLGNGDVLTENQTTPSLVDFSGTGDHVWRKVSVGGLHTCALDEAKRLYCWGSNGGGFGLGAGQLGDGTTSDQAIPVRSVLGMQFIDVSAGISATCGVAVGGATWCWGMDLYGRLGNGNALPDIFFAFGGATNSAYAGGSTAQVESGWWSSCSIKRGGDLYCWGMAIAGNIPVGRDESSAVPAKVGSGFVTVELPSGFFNSGGCGIKSDTTLWCWGFNFANLFQTDAPDRYSTPQLVKILYRKPVADAGAQFTGRAKKNSVLTADAPNFSGTPIPAVTYQWYRCTKAAGAATSTVPSTCSKITSATGSTYTLKTADVNKYVRLLITAKNKGGTVAILTASSAKVAN